MAINSTENAQKYLETIRQHLHELTQLSLDAGMHTHAAMWLAIHGAFLESMDEVKTITDMFGMYLEHKTGLRLPKKE